MSRLLVPALLLLAAQPLAAQEALPPEVQALAEATCAEDDLCEDTEVQMIPGGEAAFLWLMGPASCGMADCPTWILTAEGGKWSATDPGLSTPPGSVRWLEGGDLVFEGPTRFVEGKPVCRRIWHWTGQGIEQTDAWEDDGACVTR